MSLTPTGSDWRRRFLLIWASQAVSLVGSSIAGFAVVWWLAQTTGSATVLAASALVSSLPFILVGPLAGTLVDRLNRRLVMMCADGFVAVVSAWLAYLFWAGQVQPWHVFVIMVARSLGGASQWPAM
ncbi:MAG: MFS transporter [Anaerolineae bacterium]